ncbi:unnamed protein product [Brachionus calyciflorus]|uniref:Dolichyl-diphosphooligosaccharide--protein glycosyltransferase subunit DAD1 n=1 Tax=Brachionus calyciflorus TaxID=104777 RepID=A0A813U6N6_9BILA|nr:unnamed protein product [Brachionus calyciflorus]
MSQSAAPKGVFAVVGSLLNDYKATTPKKVKLIDAYLLCILLTGIIQFVYCCLVGTYPFNAFLSGFISTVACFVLAASYRIQINKENSKLFENISTERSFADFIFAHVILHLVVINFIG